MTATESEAVKVVWEWRVRPGAHEQFTLCIERLVDNAAIARGYEGSSVFATHDDRLVLLRFARTTDLERWQESAAAVELLAACSALAVGPQHTQRYTGLEAWFTLPGAAAGAGVPPRWKMALVTWLALLPQVIVLAFVVPPSMPFPLRAAVSTAIPVALLTWVVMPYVSRLLAPWLYKS